MNKARVTQEVEQLLNLYLEQDNASQLLGMVEASIISALQDENIARIIISFINKLIAVAINRPKGLALLDKIIFHCSPSLLMDNAEMWTNGCINYSSKEPASVLRFKVLGKMIEVCNGTPDFNKSIKVLLPKIVSLCVAVNPASDLSESSLQCLEICLQKYPTVCGPFRAQMNDYLCKYIMCHSYLIPVSTLRIAGRVFHFLQQAGGAGPSKNWNNEIIKLHSTMHKLYDKFFTKVATDFEKSCKNLPFIEIPSDERGTVPYITAKRLENLVIFMNCMLTAGFSAEKSIPVSNILSVIKRGLLVDTFEEFNNSLEETQFADLLYSLQINLLYLLRSLIACCKTNILPFSFAISKLLMDCLQRTQKKYFKHNNEYQKAVYRVLNYWITIAKNQITTSVHNKLVSQIVSEITPAKSNVMLCLNENLSKKKSPRGKKRAIQETIASTVNESTINNTQKSLENKEIICIEALKTGKTLLDHVILQLDQDTYKMLFQTLTQHVINIQGRKLQHPYTSSKCQFHLYKMLASIFMQPTFCAFPLIETVTNLFTNGKNRSTNDEISLACSEGLNLLEKLCQAINPTLCVNQFIDDNNISNSKNKKKLEYEMDEENVSDLHANDTVAVVIDDVENQNTYDTNNITQVSVQISPKSTTEKVNIISVYTIKQADTATRVDDITNIDMQEVISQEEQMPSLELQASVNGSSIQLEEDSQESSLNSLVVKKELPIVKEQYPNNLDHYDNANKSIICEVEVKNETQSDVCSLEEKSIVAEDDELDMLDSFNDVLNK